MKAEITKIKLQLKGRDIELTAQEARDVQRELNHLFEMEKTELDKLREEWGKREPNHVPMPYPVPIYIERTPIWPQPWTIYCQSTAADGIAPQGQTLCMAVGQVS